MSSVKGEDLVRICCLYENYKFRTPQRLLRASPMRRTEETAGHALRRTLRRKEQICPTCRAAGGNLGAEKSSHRKHPTGTLQIQCGKEVEECGLIRRLRRCQIGEEEQVYKHSEPPLMVTSNKLPPIPKETHGKERRPTPADLKQHKSKTSRGGPQDKQQTGQAGEQGCQDDGVGGSAQNNEGKKVSFGRARIVDDQRTTKILATHRPNLLLQSKHPSSRRKELGEDLRQRGTILLPRRGRLHLRFPGKRHGPVHPAEARLKAEDRRGVQPTLPLVGVSILKPAKPLMVVPTPCFPCSPEFERTFKSLRHQKE